MHVSVSYRLNLILTRTSRKMFEMNAPSSENWIISLLTSEWSFRILYYLSFRLIFIDIDGLLLTTTGTAWVLSTWDLRMHKQQWERNVLSMEDGLPGRWLQLLTWYMTCFTSRLLDLISLLINLLLLVLCPQTTETYEAKFPQSK